MNRKIVCLVAVVMLGVFFAGCSSTGVCPTTTSAAAISPPCRLSAAEPVCGNPSDLRAWYSGVGTTVACKRAMVCCAVPAAAGMAGTAGAASVVQIGPRGFDPAHIKISAGETVQWINNSSMTHTVTADPSLAANPADAMLPAGASAFNSGEITPGETYSHTFVIPGRYRYFSVNEEGAGMVGDVTVR